MKLLNLGFFSLIGEVIMVYCRDMLKICYDAC